MFVTTSDYSDDEMKNGWLYGWKTDNIYMIIFFLDSVSAFDSGGAAALSFYAEKLTFAVCDFLSGANGLMTLIWASPSTGRNFSSNLLYLAGYG